MSQLIAQEEFTSVQKAQAGITRLFKKASQTKSFYRIMRNQKSLGVLIPDKIWRSIIEDLEALGSQRYLTMISSSRKSKKRISAGQVKKQLGIS